MKRREICPEPKPSGIPSDWNRRISAKHRPRAGERKNQTLNIRTFRPLLPEDLPWLNRCRDAADHPFTALTGVSLISWARTYGLTVAGDDDYFVIHSRHDDGYYAPVGSPEKCAAFMEKTAAEEKSARFMYVKETDAQALARKGWSVHFRADLSEYIVSSDRLAMAPGTTVSESFRRKCRKFVQTFGEYGITPVSAENLGSLWDISEMYRDAQDSMPLDQTVLDTELERFEELNLQGIILTLPDGRGAFMLGYGNTPEMFTLTMTRHDPGMPPEVTAVCIHEYASLLRGRYPLINVEEDMGLDGLRRSKMLLSPVDLLKVYEVRP